MGEGCVCRLRALARGLEFLMIPPVISALVPAMTVHGRSQTSGAAAPRRPGPRWPWDRLSGRGRVLWAVSACCWAVFPGTFWLGDVPWNPSNTVALEGRAPRANFRLVSPTVSMPFLRVGSGRCNFASQGGPQNGVGRLISRGLSRMAIALGSALIFFTSPGKIRQGAIGVKGDISFPIGLPPHAGLRGLIISAA